MGKSAQRDKERFGKTGGNVAYYGYQRFQTGEGTPEEAYKNGLEIARCVHGRLEK